MWNSRDIALVIVLGVVGLIQGVFVVQMGTLLTGLPGVNYFFSILLTIWISLSFLIFEGRRWRLFLTVLIFIMLTIPTYVMGMPYDLSPRIPGILTILFVDVLFNSFYESFRKRGKLLRLSIFLSVFFLILDIAFRILTYPLFFSSAYVSTFLNITMWLIPVILLESVAGGYLGYKIYQKVKNLTFLKQESELS